MFKKKAFTIQFSWIFVLIVGFLVLTFVTSIIVNQEKISKKEINIEIKKNVESIFTTSEQSTNTFKIIEIPSSKIERVSELNYSAYSINNIFQRVDNVLLFMPKEIESRELLTWTKEYKMPMKITNFLYLTGPDHMYVFINNTGDNNIFEILEDFPKNITFELIQETELMNYKDRNFDHYTFIKVGVVNDYPTSSKIEKKSDILTISFDGINYNKGTINFTKHNSTDWQLINSTKFIDKSLLYGAIFASDYTGYSSNLQKLARKSSNVYRIYNYTLAKKNNFITITSCNNFYNDSHAYFNDLYLKSNVNKLNNTHLEQIYVDAIHLEIKNKNVLRFNCPLIY